MTAPLDTPQPCPFCGNAPVQETESLRYGPWHSVTCSCGASIGASSHAEALAKWNRRAPVRDETDRCQAPGMQPCQCCENRTV